MNVTELHNNPDHYVWAEEFCRIARERGFDPATSDSVEWLATWFANAMMNGYDRGRGPQVIVQPPPGVRVHNHAAETVAGVTPIGKYEDQAIWPAAQRLHPQERALLELTAKAQASAKPGVPQYVTLNTEAPVTSPDTHGEH